MYQIHRNRTEQIISDYELSLQLQNLNIVDGYSVDSEIIFCDTISNIEKPVYPKCNKVKKSFKFWFLSKVSFMLIKSF
jgi:hypothetical protein